MGKAVVFGLARSGVGAANLLVRLGMDVVVTDAKKVEELRSQVERLSPEVKLSLGGHNEGIIEGADLIVISPGVPLGIGPLKRAKERGTKIIGELELAYRMLRSLPIYAVTGTNGKSTTTTLLDLMMKNAGKRSLLGGNIGNALTLEMMKYLPDPETWLDCVVAEVSSFQLESIEEFRPKGAVILNITPDHLDRYASFEEYKEAKARVALNQAGDDFLVLNADDPACARIGRPGQRVYYFSRKKELDGAYLRGDTVYFRGAPLIAADEINIKGVHNLENSMAASCMALLAGAPAGAVRKALREFPGLEHRLEFVRELDGVRYINDSKGTNVGAVIKSLESFPSNVILIAGGRDKKGNFEELRDFMGSVKALVLIGEAREKIKKALCDMAPCYMEDTFKGAIEKAREISSTGDTVLLSPSCASFDMFKDFEDRGRQFKKVVMGL